MSAADYYAEKALDLKERVRDLERRLEAAEGENAHLNAAVALQIEGALENEERARVATELLERAKEARVRCCYAQSGYFCVPDDPSPCVNCKLHRDIRDFLAASPETPAAEPEPGKCAHCGNDPVVLGTCCVSDDCLVCSDCWNNSEGNFSSCPAYPAPAPAGAQEGECAASSLPSHDSSTCAACFRESE